MNSNSKGLLPAGAVAERLGIPKNRVYQLTREEEFNEFLVVIGDRQYRYDPVGLDAYIRRGGRGRTHAEPSQFVTA